MSRKPNHKTLFIAASKYFMSCYLYYARDISVLQDREFDSLCKLLLEHYDLIEHPHKKYLNKGDLEAGTGYSFNWTRMPSIITHSAVQWYNEQCVNGRQINRPPTRSKRKQGAYCATNKVVKNKVEKVSKRRDKAKKSRGLGL